MEEVNAYEQERMARIQANQARLGALLLTSSSHTLRCYCGVSVCKQGCNFANYKEGPPPAQNGGKLANGCLPVVWVQLSSG